MVIKTKDVLIDVARSLFATKGFANTSMNDIANASNKGRRTLYTYFKSKEDVFYAVIQMETMTIRERLKLVTMEKKPPIDKLMNYVFVRLKEVREVVIRNGGLEAEFFQNQNLVERVRHRLDFAERNYLKQILEEGKADGSMVVGDTTLAALIIHSALKGMELPYVRGELAISLNANKKEIYDFLCNGFALIKQ